MAPRLQKKELKLSGRRTGPQNHSLAGLHKISSSYHHQNILKGDSAEKPSNNSIRRPGVTPSPALLHNLQERYSSCIDTTRNLYNSMLRPLPNMAARHHTERLYFCMCSSMNIPHISLHVSSFINPGGLYLPSQQHCNPTLPSGCSCSFEDECMYFFMMLNSLPTCVPAKHLASQGLST